MCTIRNMIKFTRLGASRILFEYVDDNEGCM